MTLIQWYVALKAVIVLGWRAHDKTPCDKTDRRPSSMPWLVAAACCCLLAFVFIDPTTDSALENSTTSESPFATVILEEPEVFDNVDFYYWLDVYDTEVIASSD